MPRLALYFLGAPRIELDGESISLSHHKALALLAYLAVTGQPHTRLSLAALLWPAHEPGAARGEVRRMLWVLNKSLGRGWLVADQETIQLIPQPGLWLDIARFRELLAASQRHSHPIGQICPACLPLFTEAVELMHGGFLAGFTLPDSPDFDTWQAFETESLRRALASALERLVQLLLQSGEIGETAINYARRWLALDPLHEPAHRQLMQIYAWAGQSAAALQQYQACVRLLEQELGVPVAAEKTALYDLIKANQLPDPAMRGAQQTLAAPSIALPPFAPAPPTHNLPILATPFIGRAAALDGLQQRLADPGVRLITIMGPGGIGKTRLALALAERQLQAVRPTPAFADGIYFISLAPISSAGTIAQTIAEGLAFPLTSAEETAVQLLTYLRHKQMLLVLDNFEHVLAGATLLGHILQSCGGVKIVVTSRERLNLAGETLWPISGLNFAGLAHLDEALTYEAVQLFVQRARQVQPDFVLQAEALPHLERILQGVWGMPLAIELAAAWLHLLSVAEIAAELSSGLDVLESELHDVPGRHRSMRLVFDHSWERLNPEEKQLFKALAVFRGGFTREAAQQVAGASLRLLGSLVNRSLLTSQPGQGRYELHELLRQYAGEKLEADPPARVRAQHAHAAFFADFMQHSWSDLRTANQLTTITAIEKDIENIRAAWRYRLAERNGAELLKFMDSFWVIYDLRGWHQAAIVLFEEAAEQFRTLAGVDAGTLVHGKALGYRGFFTGIIGQPERGLILSNEAIALIRPLNQPEALAYTFFGAALNSVYLGNFEQVVEIAQALGRMTQEIGDRWGAGISLNYLATALVGQQRYAEAQAKADQALQIFGQEIGDYYGLTWAALVRGHVALARHTYAEARPFYERSLQAAQALNYRRTMQQSYDNLGDVAFHLGELEPAEHYFRLSLEISEETGQTREMIGTLHDLARVWAAQGKMVEAVELLAVVLHHPLSNLHLLLRIEETALSEVAERLRAKLEVDLDPDRYRAAWARGGTRQLEAVVDALLRQVK